MHVANLELCKELYAVSGWDDTHAFYGGGYNEVEFVGQAGYEGYVAEFANDGLNKDIPAYDLGYLLRKLPFFKMNRTDEGQYIIWWAHFDDREVADTPEDATAKLCIELIKQNILQPSVTEGEE